MLPLRQRQHDKNKFVASEMRLVKEIPQIVIKRYALECARHVLHIWTKKYPDDKRIEKCLDATEAYLKDASPKNLKILQDAADAADAAYAARYAADAAEKKYQENLLRKLIKEALK